MGIKIKAALFAIMTITTISLTGCGKENIVTENGYSVNEEEEIHEAVSDQTTEAVSDQTSEVDIESQLPNNQEEEDVVYINEYFPYASQCDNKYKAVLFFKEDINSVPINVTRIESYEDGDVYRITIQYEDIPERYYWGVTDRYNLGTFFVTEDKIYMLDGREDIPSEEEFMSNGIVVCSQEDYSMNVDGEEIKIIHEGEDCIFSRSNTLTESGFYSEYRWTKGKGLVYFRSGYGAEGDPIEITID